MVEILCEVGFPWCEYGQLKRSVFYGIYVAISPVQLQLIWVFWVEISGSSCG